MLNLTRLHLGIAHESQFQGLGIRVCLIRSHLDRANRYIAELRADIARERVVIEHALDAGYPSAVAESMLHALEGALRIFEKHRSLILDELERQPSE